ncbi:hypothetical protein TNCT_605671 [Trichonephila clavata]|uniref:Uncharacterized protein n=1 Tax=Trichonephila clavata TaxID=2740835 RepID=A0A8X6HV11_TRICU|nr:hypothetical protein TNCT_605671 [Trichonephila clavata]
MGQPSGKGLKSLKSQGSAKIGISYPAVMKGRYGVDAVSVKLWAQEMQNNEENCIVFFKEQGQSANDNG